MTRGRKKEKDYMTLEVCHHRCVIIILLVSLISSTTFNPLDTKMQLLQMAQIVQTQQMIWMLRMVFRYVNMCFRVSALLASAFAFSANFSSAHNVFY